MQQLSLVVVCVVVVGVMQLAKSFDLSLISQARVLPQDPTMFDLLFAEEGHDTIRSDLPSRRL